MRLYFLRHGEADWPNWGKADDERPLTDSGRKEVRKVARLLDKLDLCLEDVLTSPLPRARQTADIVADRFDLHVREEDALRPGFGVQELKQLLPKYHVDELMLVGHEPDFTKVIAGLTGAACKLPKAGVALVELEPDEAKGRLLWLFPPKVAKLL